MAGTRTLFGYVAISLILFFVSTPCAVTSLNVNNLCIKEERDALLKIRKDFNDPSNCLSSWVGSDCCNWSGIECDNQTGQVLKLDLQLLHICSIIGIPSSLRGKLNPSLTDLKHLSHLDLSLNDFQGIPIPKFIGSLSMLHYLDLSYANFSGMVPPHLGNLSNLQYFDISGVLSLQSVGDLSWLSGLSSLQHLDLSGVNITRSSQDLFRVVNMIPSLLELRLSFCNLFTLPSSLPFGNLTSLSVLDLSVNDFNSPIPSWLFHVSTLTQLDLSFSSLRGSLPKLGRGNLCKLQNLDLSEIVNLTGDVTQVMEALSSCSNHSLTDLDLSSNQLTGKLPNSMGQFNNLQFLYLSSNSLSGPIPPSLGNLSNLIILDLQDNKMNGTIPESISQLSQLSDLQLLQNFWEGTITNIHFRNLTNLNCFSISSNKNSLALKLTPDWAPPSKYMSELEIHDCQVGSTFPTWLRNLSRSLQYVILENVGISGEAPQWLFNASSQIQQLDLSHNRISGYLPKALNFSSLTSIDLAFNQLRGSIPLWSGAIITLRLRNNLLSGPIPANIGQGMSNLEELDLSNNQLNGSIPLSISRIQNLTYLDLSNNYLTGEIPSSWMDMQSLDVIDLSNNSLSGGIPTSICSLPSLSTLKLGNNNLSADLSSTFQNCTPLITLDLRYNRFYGSIQNLPLVWELLLRGNTLTGSIPEELCRLSFLHLLDLAENSLSGSIPPCLGDVLGFNLPPTYFSDLMDPRISDLGHVSYTKHTELVLKGMQLEYFNLTPSTIDLSKNNFSGEIPDKLTELVHLGALNLSWNQLTGNIPYNIGSLTNLESLDLSHNHLLGTIPPSMTSMTFLEHLNLSYNNLSGQIPVKNQFGTFTDPSIYEGNQHLCGDLVPNKCPSPSSPAGNGGGQEIKHEGDQDKMERLGLYASIVLGYITGFWIVCGSLVLKRSWRHAYFRFMYDMRDRLLVMITVNLALAKRKFGLETN